MDPKQRDDELVELAGYESFPASDPPSWTASGIAMIEQVEPVEEGSSDPECMGKTAEDEQLCSHAAACPDQGDEEG